MRTLRLSTVAAVCALGTVLCFVAGSVAMGSSGVGVLIPETGRPGRDWIAAVDAAGGLFYVGAWLVILMGFLGIVALVGFYDTLRLAGRVMILAPILGAVGLTLVTLSHLIPIAMGYELVLGYFVEQRERAHRALEAEQERSGPPLAERLAQMISDAYMVEGGLPEPRTDHLGAIARLAERGTAAGGSLSR
jgi:hypothetical protein